jgi:hypothetical protein
MPNFAYHAWMRRDDQLAAVTYCPSTVTVEMSGNPITIREITDYPFENTVRFRMELPAPTKFTLLLRKPQWAVDAKVTCCGKPLEANFENGTASITQAFQNGDELVLEFTDTIRVIENAGGISIKKGALLYALPVQEKTVIHGLREGGAPDFPHYSLYPESQWNYALRPAELNADYHPGQIGPQPWRLSQNGHRITLQGTQLPQWKLRRHKCVQTRLLPRDPCRWETREAIFTPKVLPVTAATVLGETAELTLVPYCTTRLRIAIFPKIVK